MKNALNCGFREAAREAKKGGFDYFTTTLTISPLKSAPTLNTIGERARGRGGSFLSAIGF